MGKKKPKTLGKQFEEFFVKPKPKKSRKKTIAMGMGVGSLIGATLMRRRPK